MERTQLKQFLRSVLGPNVALTDQGQWVSLHCPFAQWTHARGADSRPSSGVSVSNERHSIFNCYTCKKKGNLAWMLRTLTQYTGEDFPKTIRDAVDSEELGAGIPEWGQAVRKDTIGEPVDSDYLDIYDSAVGHPYLRGRNVSDDTARALDLRVDPDNHGEERILFPVYSMQGAFYGYTGRAVRRDAVPPIRDYFGLPKKHLLLGSEFISGQDRFVILVEGPFDFANVFSFGLPVVASLHSDLTVFQARILRDLSLPVYAFFDPDAAGQVGVEKAAELLRDHVPVMKVRYPSVSVQVRGARKQNKLDPAVLTEKQIRAMIADARLL